MINIRNYDHPLLDRDYRLPIIYPYFEFPIIKKTTFPSMAYEAGAINVSEPIDLKKSSIITKPEPEFYQKYYEVNIDHVKHKRPHKHKHSHHKQVDERRDEAPLKQRPDKLFIKKKLK